MQPARWACRGRRRFLPADGIAVALWALYAAGLGYLGGATFQNNLWLPMLIGAGASLIVGGIGELVRRKVLDREPTQEPMI
jgi:membrane protein DedA with SNARE-associated domain